MSIRTASGLTTAASRARPPGSTATLPIPTPSPSSDAQARYVAADGGLEGSFMGLEMRDDAEREDLRVDTGTT